MKRPMIIADQQDNSAGNDSIYGTIELDFDGLQLHATLKDTSIPIKMKVGNEEHLLLPEEKTLVSDSVALVTLIKASYDKSKLSS